MMDGSNLKRGHTRLKGGSTSHPVGEYKSYTCTLGGIFRRLYEVEPVDRAVVVSGTYLKHNRSPFKNGGVGGEI